MDIYDERDYAVLNYVMTENVPFGENGDAEIARLKVSTLFDCL